MREGAEGVPNIERQLGDVVGTVRMAVAAIETLRETVERLAERAAFKADLEGMKSEYHRRIEDVNRANQELEKKHAITQRWMWMSMGVLAAFIFAANFLKPVILHTFGG
jgi:FtsZ-binding cell division protein ZapB